MSGHSPPYTHEQIIEFGPYRLDRSQKLLLNADRPVRLGSRAFDILVALVERAGETVTKRELNAYAWPNSFVEDTNLRVHVATLRKVLGDGRGGVRYIVNVPGRGYRFIATVRRFNEAPRQAPAAILPAGPSPAVPTGLPAPLTHVVGRKAIIESIAGVHLLHRLVTLIGPGGIGKSTVALAVAENAFNKYEQRAYLIDLTSIDNPLMVPSAVATAMGVSVLDDDPLGSLAAHLRSQQMFIVLDNCEHVIGPVALLVEHILRIAPHVRILATSREPLKSASETIVSLPPLTYPPESIALNATTAMKYTAIELFVERAMSSADAFELTDSNASLVGHICQYLDGSPLAIELTAARVDLFSLEELASRLTDQLLLNAKGRRTAHSRHTSLRATLDWSHELLCAREQQSLRRLAIFRGPFSMESAAAVVSDACLSTVDVMDCLISLVDKSLITADISRQVTRYRLSPATRAYALEKLFETEGDEQLHRRHAEHFRELLQSAQATYDTTSRQQWLAEYGHTIQDVRAALDWAFSSNGDLRIGASLTAAALPFGLMFSLIEFKRWAQLARAALARFESQQPLTELRITSALIMLHSLTGDSHDSMGQAVQQTKQIAERIGLPRYKIEPLLGQAFHQLESADYEASMETACELAREARETDDPLAMLISDRVGAQMHHWAGQHDRSHTLAERALSHPAAAIPLTYTQMGIDRRVSMRIVLARISWLQGYYDRSRELMEQALTIARQAGSVAHTQALAMAGCQIAFWSGDIERARQRVAELMSTSRKAGLLHWYRLACCFQTVVSELLNRVSRPDAGNPPMLVRPATPLHRDELATICDYWLDADTIARAERGQPSWCAAEVLRAAGELSLRAGLPDCHQEAESRFRRSLTIAAAQGAVTWELRSAISLGRLLRARNCSAEALDLIQPVLARIVTTLATPDVTEARLLLASLQRFSSVKQA